MSYISAGTIKRIHVNRQNIAMNRKNSSAALPCLTIKTSKANHKCNSVKINGPSKVVYQPEKPLQCGAVAWIETHAEVEYG